MSENNYITCPKCGKKILITIAITLLVLATTAHAQLYRCQENGKTVFSNIPCANAQVVTTGDISTVKFKNVPDPTATPTPTTTREQRQTNTAPRTQEPSKKRLTAEDYNFSKSADEVNGRVEIGGRLTGPTCQSLRIEVFARSNNGGIESCVTVVRHTGGSTLYSCTAGTWRQNDNWFVSSLFMDCQD